MTFPFAAHKANRTAVFTRCSSFPLKIHLERAFLPAVRGFLQIFFCLSNPESRKLAIVKKKIPLTSYNTGKSKMDGHFPCFVL